MSNLPNTDYPKPEPASNPQTASGSHGGGSPSVPATDFPTGGEAGGPAPSGSAPHKGGDGNGGKAGGWGSTSVPATKDGGGPAYDK